MKNRCKISLFVVAGFLVSCGDDTDSVPGASEYSLNESDRSIIDDWRQRLVKDCSIHQIFPRLAPYQGDPTRPDDQYVPSLFVDSRILFEKTGGTSTITSSRGEIVVLGTPTELSGSTSSRREITIGNTVVLNVSADIEPGSKDCIVMHNGEEIYRVPFYTSVPVVAYFSVSDTTETATLTTATTELDLDGSAVEFQSRNQNRGLADEIKYLMGPESNLHTLIANTYNADITEISQKFSFNPTSPVTAQPNDTGIQTWFSPEVGRLFGDTTVLRNLFVPDLDQQTNSPTPFDATYFYEIPVIRNDPFYQRTDQRLLGVDIVLNLSNPRAGSAFRDNMIFDASISSAGIGVTRAHSDTEASDCIGFHLNRSRLLELSLGELPGRGPTSTSVFGACQPLTLDIYEALSNNARVRQSVIAHIFDGTVENDRFRYFGWDSVAKSLVQTADRLGQNIADVFVGSIGMTNVLNRIQTLSDGLSPDLTVDQFRPDIIALPLDWFFNRRVVPPSLVSDLLSSFQLFDSTAYEQLLEELIRDLSDRSFDQDFDGGVNQVTCAAGFTTAMVDSLQAAIQRSRRRSELQGWAEDYVTNLLITCPSETQLAALEAAVEDALTFATTEDALTDGNDPLSSYEQDLTNILTRAVNEGWTTNTYNELGEIAEYVSVSLEYSFCTTGTNSERIRCAEPLGLRGLSVTEMLNPQYNGRYGLLADRLTQVHTDFLSQDLVLAPRIENAFFERNPILWGQCSNEEFTNRENTLMTLLDNYRAASGIDGFEIVRNIETHLESDCTP